MIGDPALVARISAWLAETDIALLELRGPDGVLRLVRSGRDIHAETAEADTEAADEDIRIVPAPCVGVFLDRHPLRLDAAAMPGARVMAGEALGFLRIGPVLRAVEAPCDCLVHDVLAAHETVVGYGAPLFAILPQAQGKTT